MKRLLFSLFLISIFAISAKAQEKAFQFGFKIGPNIGWIKPNSEGYERDGVNGAFNWGFVADIHLVENYSVHTGFNVLYLNGSYMYPYKAIPEGESEPVTGVMNRTLKLKYIQIPAVLRMKTQEMNNLTYYAEAGFGLAFKTKATADDLFTKDGATIKLEEKIDVGKQYRFSRESLILGLGAYYSLGPSTKLTGGIRFDNNFFDILKDQNTVDPTIEQKAISNFVEITFGLLF
ncbi:MAG: hypothetical protein CVT92_08210 [Bacteroidetes bacterium HGW-Bacteroidetes-1]|jgi:hypothetical protein|nr:MAG: hypothetical protein CVT92_08210 [Bacteroidetes bacterium HGW-Bacteroidetes-1]